MGANFIQILCSILLIWICRCAAIRVGCPTNKVAPKLYAEGRTFGLLFGNRYQYPQNDANANDCSNRPVASVGDPETDYDPVSSGEDIGDATKPVHEYIENDEINVTWRPGTIVGGPNNDIIGVTQDLSNWSTIPTPRPTRPYIPGQRVPSSKYENQGIIGSFIDLFMKK